MLQVNIDCAKSQGIVKPMHAVNNGPSHKFASDQRISNLEAYKDAGIPYARNHDAAFYSTYGGEHCVDIVAIFPDFDADPYDPASYDFQLTDEYIQVTALAGTETYYRLGNKIEHWSKKYGTLPPKDFKKWAIICEHIIRHYNYGWANGFHMNLQYWEIWNEPDLDPDDSTHKRCWGGTAEEFYEFFDIAANHLKSCFPELKIGGPACCGLHEEWLAGFFSHLTAPLDFFSWHCYAYDPHELLAKCTKARKLLDDAGYPEAESILNEWNYVKGWRGEEWQYSLRMEKSLKGAAFVAACISGCQYAPLDMLMYYDARPCGMNGMFSTDNVTDLLKGYYPFKMFHELYKIGNSVAVESDDSRIYVSAASDAKSTAAMITYYDDEEKEAGQTVKVHLQNVPNDGALKVEFYLLDQEHDMELVREEITTAKDFAVYLKLPLFGTYLVKLLPIEE